MKTELQKSVHAYLELGDIGKIGIIKKMGFSLAELPEPTNLRDKKFFTLLKEKLLLDEFISLILVAPTPAKKGEMLSAEEILYKYCGDKTLNDGKSLWYLAGQEDNIKNAMKAYAEQEIRKHLEIAVKRVKDTYGEDFYLDILLRGITNIKIDLT